MMGEAGMTELPLAYLMASRNPNHLGMHFGTTDLTVCGDKPRNRDEVPV
jgi:hypothetical protein